MSNCGWCGRSNIWGGHARCAAERRRARRLVSTLARVRDQEGVIRLTAAFFDELRLRMALGDTAARAFVEGTAGQFVPWCALLSVPDEEAVRSHLLARWVERQRKPRKERAWRPCRCGERDIAKFRRRKDGYRSLCRECENRADRQRRAMKKGA